MNTADIEKRQVVRFRLLHLAYEKGLQNPFNLYTEAFKVDIKNGVFDEALSFLNAEDLIKATDKGGKCTITHEGKKIVEYILTHKDERTALFPAFSEMGL